MRLIPYPHRWKCTQVVPNHPQTIGDHLKKHRLKRHLLQQDVAKRFGVHVETLKNWERGVGAPMVRQMPQIIRFLGYDPTPEASDLAGQIRLIRRRLGLTQKQFAAALHIDPGTLYRWENGKTSPTKAEVAQLELLLASAEVTRR